MMTPLEKREMEVLTQQLKAGADARRMLVAIRELIDQLLQEQQEQQLEIVHRPVRRTVDSIS